MPIIVHGDGTLTFSAKFDHEAFVWLELASIDPAEVESALGLPAGASRPEPPIEEVQATVWMCRVDPGTDVGATLGRAADRLATAADFLAGVRADGGRYGCLVLCHVDFNAQPLARATPCCEDWAFCGSISRSTPSTSRPRQPPRAGAASSRS